MCGVSFRAEGRLFAARLLRRFRLVVAGVLELAEFLVVKGFADALVFCEPAAEVYHLAAGRAERPHGRSEKVDGSAAGGAVDGVVGAHVEDDRLSRAF